MSTKNTIRATKKGCFALFYTFFAFFLKNIWRIKIFVISLHRNQKVRDVAQSG